MQKHIKSLLRRTSLFISIFVTLLIAYLSLAKLGSQPINFNHLDKLEHALAYSVLSFFWLLSIGTTIKRQLVISMLCVLCGVFMEFLQSTTAYRTFDYLDMLANTIGVLIGFLIYFFIGKKKNLIN